MGTRGIATAGLLIVAVTTVVTTGVGRAVGTDAYWSQLGAVPGGPERLDRFGSALAVGDFDGDTFDDLAIGVPGEAIGAVSDAGAVNVLYGSSDGLTATGSQGFSQSTSGIAGGVEIGDRFGAALAAGDFDGDGFDDLAIGVPGEAIGSTLEAGMVHVLFGSDTGLVTAGSIVIHQDSPGVNGVTEPHDRFGHSLAAGDLTGSFDDLVIGVPFENIGAVVDSGALHFIPGSGAGLVLGSEFSVGQDAPGFDAPAEGERFGWSLAIADFDGSGPGDLAASAPWESVDGGEGLRPNAGIVAVIEGSASGPVASPSTVTIENGITQLSDPTNRLFGRDLAVRASTGGGDPFTLVVGVRDSTEGSGGGAEVFRFDGDMSGEGLDPQIGRHPSTEPGTAVAGRLANHGQGESPGVFVGIPRADDGPGPASGAVDGWAPSDVFGQADGPGTPEFGDGFATDLAVGDFDGDGLDDLAAGIPGEDIGDLTDAGGVVVAYGVNHPWL